MVKFRRSKMGSTDGVQKPPSVSIPQKDAIAIVPPKKVIKALYDYEPPNVNAGYLAFNTGDFLHVVGRENDEDWYEACNPIQGLRGLVPVKYFQEVGKNMRASGGSVGSGGARQSGGGHDSGYAESSNSPPAAASGMGHNGNGMRMSKSAGGGAGMSAAMAAGLGMGKGQGAMVYGIVMYDFKAERPDELDAKEGEAIIVIAQSNPEWFVAKPITRLGGPGLIPVSFIEIRDMGTGKAVPDATEAVQRAGVPKVEEWKKMAADYKNGSIPLGTLSGGSAGGIDAMQQGMGRMSIQGQQGQNGYTGNGGQQQQSRGYSQQYGGGGGTNANQPYVPPAGLELLAPLKASVPRYCFADDIFWFIVEVQMEDGRHWELQRLYQDFYDLQINLIQEFPQEAGNIPGYERTLPFMPGPVTYVTDNISNGRRANLDEYIRKLLKLGQSITKGYLVRRFFAPREGDYELDPAQVDSYRLSQASQHSTPDPSNPISQQSSAGNLSHPNVSAYAQQPSGYPQHQRNQSSMSAAGGPGGSSLSLNPGGMPRMPSNISGVSGGSAPSPSSSAQPCKIKVWFSDQDCVVVRMPPVGQFRYSDLYRKLKERRVVEYGNGGNEELEVSYRDESRGGALTPLADDRGLEEALRRNGKLVLDVRGVR